MDMEEKVILALLGEFVLEWSRLENHLLSYTRHVREQQYEGILPKHQDFAFTPVWERDHAKTTTSLPRNLELWVQTVVTVASPDATEIINGLAEAIIEMGSKRNTLVHNSILSRALGRPVLAQFEMRRLHDMIAGHLEVPADWSPIQKTFGIEDLRQTLGAARGLTDQIAELHARHIAIHRRPQPQ